MHRGFDEDEEDQTEDKQTAFLSKKSKRGGGGVAHGPSSCYFTPRPLAHYFSSLKSHSGNLLVGGSLLVIRI